MKAAAKLHVSILTATVVPVPPPPRPVQTLTAVRVPDPAPPPVQEAELALTVVVVPFHSLVYVQSIARQALGPVALLTVNGDETAILSIVPEQLVQHRALSKHPRLTLPTGIMNEHATLQQQESV